MNFALNFKADEVTEEQLLMFRDWYADYEPTSQINPTGPAESETHMRVIRGGSWAYSLCNHRS